jgi:hypothetical protein
LIREKITGKNSDFSSASDFFLHKLIYRGDKDKEKKDKAFILFKRNNISFRPWHNGGIIFYFSDKTFRFANIRSFSYGPEQALPFNEIQKMLDLELTAPRLCDIMILKFCFEKGC